MAKKHAELQREVKNFMELYGWYVVENKKGKSSSRYNSGVKGMADLLAIKPRCEILWLEIKTPHDIQKPAQKDFQKKVELLGHKYYLIFDLAEIEHINRINNKEI